MELRRQKEVCCRNQYVQVRGNVSVFTAKEYSRKRFGRIEPFSATAE